jgi:hypothetical protein
VIYLPSKDTLGPGIKPYFRIIWNRRRQSPLMIGQSEVESFEITEKEQEFTTGTFVIRDETGIYNKIFRMGETIEIEWGLESVKPQFIKFFPNELNTPSGKFQRGALTAHVFNFSQTCANGTAKLNVGFRMGYASASYARQKRTIKTGTVGSFVKQLITELRAESADVQFKNQNDPVTPQNPIRQNNITNIQMLYRLANKYNVRLIYQHDPLSTRIAKVYFVSWNLTNRTNYARIRGFAGLYHVINYGGTYGNVFSGTPSVNFNLQGGSSVIPITLPDGRQSLQVVRSEKGETTVYVLNEAKIRAALRRLGATDRAELLQTILAADFREFERDLLPVYFTRRRMSTAPEGFAGLSCTWNVIPYPHYQVGDLVWQGPPEGGESLLAPFFQTQKKNLRFTLWRITQVQWKHDGSGVKQSVEVKR